MFGMVSTKGGLPFRCLYMMYQTMAANALHMITVPPIAPNMTDASWPLAKQVSIILVGRGAASELTDATHSGAINSRRRVQIMLRDALNYC